MNLEYTAVVLNGNMVKPNRPFRIHAVRIGIRDRTMCGIDLAADPYASNGKVSCPKCLERIKNMKKNMKKIKEMKEGR